MWLFRSPARHANTSTTSYTPAKRATPQRYKLTAHLQPGTPEARRAAAGLRRRAQSLMVQAQKTESEQRARGKKTDESGTSSGANQPAYSARSRTVPLRSRTTPSARPRSCTPPQRPSSLPSHLRSRGTHTPSSTHFLHPPSPTTTVLQSTLTDLTHFVQIFVYSLFTGRTPLDPATEKARKLCASFFWAKSPETLEFVRSVCGCEGGWQDLWMDDVKRREVAEKVIWRVLWDQVFGVNLESADKYNERHEDEDVDEAEEGLTPQGRLARLSRTLTDDGITVDPWFASTVQNLLAALLGHLTPFFALMHENPYHNLDATGPNLAIIAATAVFLHIKFHLNPDTMYGLEPCFQEGCFSGKVVPVATDEEMQYIG